MKTSHKIIKKLLEANEQLEQQLEEKEAIIIMMEHDQQKLVEVINSICRETVL